MFNNHTYEKGKLTHGHLNNTLPVYNVHKQKYFQTKNNPYKSFTLHTKKI